MGELVETGLIFSSNATVERQTRINSLTWVLWFLLVLSASGLLGLEMVFSSQKLALIGWLLFFVGIALILYQPRYGVYLIIFLSLVGDKGLIYWYPFLLNFSSGESLLYLNPSIIFSPMEVYLVTTVLSWLVRVTILRRPSFRKGELFWPVMIFMTFVVFGLAYGLGRGGNTNVGLWEVRPIIYLPVMLILVSNLITERGHIYTLMWLVLSALFIEGLLGSVAYLSALRNGSRIVTELFMEHTAAVHMASFFIFILALWIYKGSKKVRILLFFMVIPVLFTFIIFQRRSAFAALLIALIFVAFILFKEYRSAFWIIVPTLTSIFVVFVIAFWNNQGTLGFPARTVKSMIAPQQVSMRDRASDIYRIIENYDIYYTIKQAPLTGIGFGHMFSMVIPLPDISFFIWWRYISHNSIGWFWMKTGMGGFVAMLFLVGLSIMNGVRALFRMPGGMMSAVLLTATLYILMHFIFAYVDMAWDNQSMIYLGVMMGLIGCAESILAQRDLSGETSKPVSAGYQLIGTGRQKVPK
jgi:hypothetical protein